MLSNFRRKTGVLSTVPGTPRMTSQMNGMDMTQLPTLPQYGNEMAVGELDGGLQSLLSLPMGNGNPDVLTGLEGLWEGETGGFDWPTEFSPSNLPVWLQDGVSWLFAEPLHTDVNRILPISDYLRTARTRYSCLLSRSSCYLY
jgi:hypothetical protein